MATHNIHYRANQSAIGTPAAEILAKTLSSSVEKNTRQDLNGVTTILAYLIGLAAVAVVVTTGQFPWFLLTLALAGTIAFGTVRIMNRRRVSSRSDAFAA